MKKKLTFIISAILFSSFIAIGACHAQTADSTVAAQFINLNNEGKYSEAAQLMSPAFLAMVSVDNLQKIWYWHVQPHGKFHGISSVRQMQQGKIYAVFTTCLYDNADITFAFAFDDNHQIAGFHIDTVTPKSSDNPVPKAVYPATENSSASR